jgi:shikimate dehydrogenase
MTDKYAVIGNPIAHSKSPLIHKMFAEQTRQDISYEAVLAPLDGFAATVERLRKEGYKGCNVTVPFKFEAFELAKQSNNLGPSAALAQAANTLAFLDDGRIFGENTDGIGLVADIQGNLRFSLNGKRVLLMGAGGAAYGVALPLLAAGATITVGNRTPEKAVQLAERFADFDYLNISGCGYGDLAGHQFDVIINATSSGLSGEMPPLPPGIFAPSALAYDMLYGRETPFMKFAREQGAAIVADGLGMLVEQAAAAFKIWRGVSPDTQPVLTKLRAL